LKGKVESVCNDQKNIPTMASAISSTVSEDGSTDVRVDGSLVGALGVVAAKAASVGLRVVFALL